MSTAVPVDELLIGDQYPLGSAVIASNAADDPFLNHPAARRSRRNFDSARITKAAAMPMEITISGVDDLPSNRTATLIPFCHRSAIGRPNHQVENSFTDDILDREAAAV